jgi:hypothetical protein
MTSRDFCFWLQGYFELQKLSQPLTIEQSEMIRKHLQLVFIHEIDPSIDKGNKEKKDELDHIHTGDDLLKRPPGARC